MLTTYRREIIPSTGEKKIQTNFSLVQCRFTENTTEAHWFISTYLPITIKISIRGII